ncbi:hypothetical protein [Streptomyces sp. YIM B13518]|uniref:hypothetical protein n=1 Tax=Streptomyces sp. YIM B13518 TaxID=3366316 RepID=UPI00368BC2CE
MGAWSSGAQADAYGHDNHWSGTAADEYYRIQFKGRGVDLYGALGSHHGIAAVSVDGGPETEIDFYAPARRDNVLVWSSPLLRKGTHTLTVRVTGTKNTASAGACILADRVDVLR